MSSNTSLRTISADHRRFARLGYAAIALGFGAFGLWAAQAPLDSAAIAQGTIEVESRKKPIQHLEGGIIREILVRESEAVKEGQLLFRLEPTQALANAELLRKQLDAALAQEARLVAEVEGRAEIVLSAALVARSAVPETTAVIADQQKQFAERRHSLLNQVRILEARIDQTNQEIVGRQRQEAALTEQKKSLAEELAVDDSLAHKGYFPRNKLRALERERARLQGEEGRAQADIARSREAIEEARLQIAQLEQRFREEASQGLTDVRVRLSDLREKLSVAEDVLTRVEVRAPKSGVVQNLKVTTPGAVVRPGDTIGELVPVGDSLIVAAQISPLDIDAVSPGQVAEVRLPALAPRRSRAVLGRVDKVSPDTIVNEATKQPVYLAQIVVDQSKIPAETAARLVPGMQADVLIATGERTLLEYLSDPLSRIFAKSLRER
jgi:HlyD family secretion protein